MPQQSAFVSGHHNIVVQAMGNDITVNVNQPYLTLVAWHRRPTRVSKVLDLLNPFEQAIPLAGMDSLRSELHAWLSDRVPISVRCAIGSAGAGKTRLAIELCAKAEAARWHAGFITYQELKRFGRQQNLSSWGWSKDTLIVVDYAAGKSSALRNWFIELALNQEGTKNRLRVLLLERHADAASGWWHELMTPGTFSEEPLAELFDSPHPILLPSIEDVEFKRTILASVMTKASELLGKRTITPPTAGSDPEFDSRLGQPMVASVPLDLIMAGVTAVQEGLPTLLSRSHIEMAQRLARVELDRIAKIAEDRAVNRNLAQLLGAGVTLIGGCSCERLLKYIAKEAKTFGCVQTEPIDMRSALEAALGSDDSRLLPVLPDLIGEGLFIAQVKTLPITDQEAFITRWFRRSRRPTAEALVRATQDYLSDEAPLRWFGQIAAKGEDIEALLAVSAVLPESSVRLQKIDLGVHQELIDRLGSAGRGHPLLQNLLVANSTARLGVASAAAGKHLAAFENFSKAIEIWRLQMLMDADRMAQLVVPIVVQNLAWLLSCAGNELSELHRYQEAYDASRESVDIDRKLVQYHPGHFELRLANSLNNFSTILQDLRRYEEALAASNEAIQIFRECNSTGEEIGGSLAMSLNNLGNQLAALGRDEDALQTSKEAVSAYRELAAAKPDVFRPGLAMAVYNLTFRFRTLNRLEEAALAALEALEIYRQLEGEQPHAFAPDVASACGELADVLARSGRFEPAYGPASEALHVYRKLGAVEPTIFRPKLARALDRLADIHRCLGRVKEASDLLAEAVTINREAASAQPQWFGPDYAESSARLGQWLIHLEQFDVARKCFADSADQYRQLVNLDSDKFRPLLAYALCFLAASLFDASLRSDAFQAIEEAVEQIGPVFLAKPAPLCRWANLIIYSYTGLMPYATHDSSDELTALANEICLKLSKACTEDMPIALSHVYMGYTGPQAILPNESNRATRILLAYHQGRVSRIQSLRRQ
jgi:tetratricopeptide (TPR) repeat protein